MLLQYRGTNALHKIQNTLIEEIGHCRKTNRLCSTLCAVHLLARRHNRTGANGSGYHFRFRNRQHRRVGSKRHYHPYKPGHRLQAESNLGLVRDIHILANKLFFFADTEENRIIFGNPAANYSVPSDKEKNGDFSELLDPTLTGAANAIQLYQPGTADPSAKLSCNNQNNVFCPNQINPVRRTFSNFFRNPTSTTESLYNNYEFQSNSSSNTFQFDGRLDWNPSTKDQAYARFSYSNQLQYYPPPLGPILDDGSYGSDGNVNAFGENFMLSETHSITSSLINEFRFGYNYGHFSDTQPNANVLQRRTATV